MLDLNTLIERPVIRIDGEKYEILTPDELSVLDWKRFLKTAGRLEEIVAMPELGDDETEELSNLLIDLTDKIMVGVPSDVRSKLNQNHLLSVAGVFTTLLTKRAAAGQKAKGKPKKSRASGVRRSRGSSASTAEARPAG